MSRQDHTLAVFPFPFLFVLTACETQPRSDPFEVRVHVHDVEGAAVPEALVALAGHGRGKTNADGTLSTSLAGAPGAAVAVEVTCPPGHVEASVRETVVLARTHSLDEPRGVRPVDVTMLCTKETRAVALVVHAPNAPWLPIRADGTEVARTNARGTAHVVLTRHSAAQALDLTLDTSADPLVKPKNPNRTFTLGSSDEVLVFHPELSRQAAPQRRRKPAPAAPVPYRLR